MRRIYSKFFHARGLGSKVTMDLKRDFGLGWQEMGPGFGGGNAGMGTWRE